MTNRRYDSNVLRAYGRYLQFCFCLFFFLSHQVFSQDYEKIAPKIPDNKQESVIIEEDLPVSKSDDILVIIPELKGLVFYNSIDELVADGVNAKGVVVGELSWLNTPAFNELFNAFLSGPMSMKSLNNLVNQIVVVSREENHPVVDVFVPAQDITGGVIQVVIFEGKVSEVIIEGNEWFTDESFHSKIRMKRGNSILRELLIGDLDWINENPFINATAAFKRGDGEGETDVIIKVKDRNPLQLYTGYENNGNKLTDRGRLFSGAIWGNAFHLGHQMGFQATTNPDNKKFRAMSLNYTIPLPWRHTIMFFGGLTRSSVHPDINVKVDGESMQAGFIYKMNFPGVKRYSHLMQLGMDMKRTNNNLEFSGTTISDTYLDIVQANALYHGSLHDLLGETEFDLSYVYSPGKVSKFNDNSSFQMMRRASQANYEYINLKVERNTDILRVLTHRVKASAQFSDVSLNSSEQMGLGGSSTVRGYEQRQASGDRGYFFNNELITSAGNASKVFKTERNMGRVQGLLFWDYGKVSDNSSLPGTEKTEILSSAGVGLRYNLMSTLIFNVDHGQQLRKNTESSASGRTHVYMVMYY